MPIVYCTICCCLNLPLTPFGKIQLAVIKKKKTEKSLIELNKIANDEIVDHLIT